MGDHHCHAIGCTVATPPRLLMCGRHWRMVPKELQRAVHAHFNPRQCAARNRVEPTPQWFVAAFRARAAVARAEGNEQGAKGQELHAAFYEEVIRQQEQAHG